MPQRTGEPLPAAGLIRRLGFRPRQLLAGFRVQGLALPESLELCNFPATGLW